jgi:phosphate/sulfate permease
MILFFLTSGIFLGWSLGANDASTAFGSAVGSKLVSFRKAAVIASVFVIIGAVIQGAGTSETLGKLGAVNALGGSFTVALAAAVTVYVMTKFALPVSTTQAIVGAIIGWNLFTGNPTESRVLSEIVATWISGPVIGALFTVLLFILLRNIKRKANIHLIRFESYIRTGLIITGAFASYSLGANNIANVMGVFIPAFNLREIDLGIFTLSSDQQLFLLGGLAIASGIIMYSRRVMETVGSSIVELSSDAALIVVLSQSLVLFLFSSSFLSDTLKSIGLPPIPMVPVSSTQVIIGSITGIGLYKGMKNINLRLLGEIAAGWITTPLASGLLSFLSLFFVKNIFNINVGEKLTPGNASVVQGANGLSVKAGGADVSTVMRYFLLCIIIAGLVTLIVYYLLERSRTRQLRHSEEKFWKNMK